MKKPPESELHLPESILNHASALLVAREIRRPAATLAFLAQELLRWRTVLRGAPVFDAAGLKPLARDFREMGFDCLPGRLPRWTPAQKTRTETLFLELALWVVAQPAMDLPRLPPDLAPAEHPRLAPWIWNHLDFHVTALTIGLMGSGILAVTPEDPRFESQAPLRERVVQLVGTLVALALYLGGPHGTDLPAGQALPTASALLDGLAESLEGAFAAGGARGLWLARSGGWTRPDYPCRMEDFSRLAQSLPPEVQPG